MQGGKDDSLPLSHDWDVVVVGGGASGMFAAFRAAERGRRTLLVEKNPKLAAKILISGGTRCNLTHATDRRGIAEAFGPAGAFLHSALSRLGPDELVALLAAEGVPTCVEPETGKVFPASDRASDVVAALGRRLRRSGCVCALGEPLVELRREDDGFRLTMQGSQGSQGQGRTISARAVVLATGGKSYPKCGTTGDGYAWAETLGHRIVPPRPALVPLRTDERWVGPLQGITIPDAQVRIEPADTARQAATQKGSGVVFPGEDANNAPIARSPPGKTTPDPFCVSQRRGAVLFAHFGLSGPAVLDVSRAVSGHPQPQSLAVVCDFVPDCPEARLLEALGEACAAAGKRRPGTLLSEWLPARLAQALVERLGLESRPAAELSKADRRRIVAAMKRCPIQVSGTLGFQKAEVTAGGVTLDEVDSRTMQSKIVPGLYITGELLNVDGPIGGYNLQAAFSTGWLAGESV